MENLLYQIKVIRRAISILQTYSKPDLFVAIKYIRDSDENKL